MQSACHFDRLSGDLIDMLETGRAFLDELMGPGRVVMHDRRTEMDAAEEAGDDAEDVLELEKPEQVGQSGAGRALAVVVVLGLRGDDVGEDGRMGCLGETMMSTDESEDRLDVGGGGENACVSNER